MTEVRVLQSDLPSLQTFSLPLGWVSTAAFLGRHVWSTRLQLLLFPLNPSEHRGQAQVPFSSTSLKTLARIALPSSLSWSVSGWNLLSQAAAWVPELWEEPSAPKMSQGGVTRMGVTSGDILPLPYWHPAPLLCHCPASAGSSLPLAHSLHFCWGFHQIIINNNKVAWVSCAGRHESGHHKRK